MLGSCLAFAMGIVMVGEKISPIGTLQFFPFLYACI
jgi:hypothetical protein